MAESILADLADMDASIRRSQMHVAGTSEQEALRAWTTGQVVGHPWLRRCDRVISDGVLYLSTEDYAALAARMAK